MRQLARARVTRSLTVVALLATLTAGAVLSGASPAGAATSFKLPFRCGETWKASTYRGHSSNSVDWNRSGEDRGYPVLASAAGTFQLAAIQPTARLSSITAEGGRPSMPT